MTAADFLAWDAHEPVRHEFVRGEVYAMAGGEDRNATVTAEALWDEVPPPDDVFPGPRGRAA